MLLLLGGTAQAQYEAAPYYWVFYSGVGDDSGFSARRRQEGTIIELHASTQDNLIAIVQEYENGLAARGIPVSPEWGQVYGSTASDRRRLLSLG